MRYYFWIDIEEEPISKATPYSEDIELAAEQECKPKDAMMLTTGTKEQLMSHYGLDDTDFEEDEI
jgi:hypothetical protein